MAFRIKISLLGSLWMSMCMLAFGQGAKDPSIVFVEGYDRMGDVQQIALGVVVKEGFVATNYHAIAGMDEVGVFSQNSPQKIVSNGYLSVDEKKDIIIISAPGLDAPVKSIGFSDFPSDGELVSIFPEPDNHVLNPVEARRIGQKNLFTGELPQLLSDKISECTSGPVFQEDKLVGFVVAGYLEDQYYAYALPAHEIRRHLNRSFIIKSFTSLADQDPLPGSYYQISLVENLAAVLWLSLPEAAELAEKNDKMILIDVYTEWSGWSKLMERNTYSEKRIIRFINENFYAVRFNAESQESVQFNQLTYKGDQNGSYHTLAYSLLEGKMDFPSTVFLDEDLNVLLVVPGYMDRSRMEVVLHYFGERAYLNERQTFQDFEIDYWSKSQLNR